MACLIPNVETLQLAIKYAAKLRGVGLDDILATFPGPSGTARQETRRKKRSKQQDMLKKTMKVRICLPPTNRILC